MSGNDKNTNGFDDYKPINKKREESHTTLPDVQASSPTSSPAPQKRAETHDIGYSHKAKTPRPRVVDFDDIDPENAKIRKNKIILKNVKTGTTAALGAMKVFVYFAAVVAVSVFLALTIINVANDVFAFVKDDSTINVTIPEGASLNEVSQILKDEGIIKYPLVFRLYAKREFDSSKYLTGEFKPGTFELSPMMNYDTLIYRSAVSTYKPRESVRVTIPEGYTVDEIIALLVEKGVGEKEDYIDVIQNYEYDYDFVKALDNNGISKDPDRKYRLEGYLFPDTYDFFTDESEISVINKLLSNFDLKFVDLYRERAGELGMTIDDVVILSSIIEKEARFASDFSYISSVFHNRLDDNHRLESCATVLYVLGERKTRLSKQDTETDSAYNTYLHAGLTPGAISNPGLEAISAALYPEKTNYYYFFAKKNGTTVYSTTYSQHINRQNQAEAQGEF